MLAAVADKFRRRRDEASTSETFRDFRDEVNLSVIAWTNEHVRNVHPRRKILTVIRTREQLLAALSAPNARVTFPAWDRAAFELPPLSTVPIDPLLPTEPVERNTVRQV